MKCHKIINHNFLKPKGEVIKLLVLPVTPKYDIQLYTGQRHTRQTKHTKHKKWRHNNYFNYQRLWDIVLLTD